MVKEPPVFDRSDGIDQIRRQFVEGHQAALGAVLAFGEPGDELRFQLIGIQRLAAIAGDPADQAVVERDGGALLGVVRLRARLDGDAGIVERVRAHPRAVAITVSAVTRICATPGQPSRGVNFCPIRNSLGAA